MICSHTYCMNWVWVSTLIHEEYPPQGWHQNFTIVLEILFVNMPTLKNSYWIKDVLNWSKRKTWHRLKRIHKVTSCEHECLTLPDVSPITETNVFI